MINDPNCGLPVIALNRDLEQRTIVVNVKAKAALLPEAEIRRVISQRIEYRMNCAYFKACIFQVEVVFLLPVILVSPFYLLVLHYN